MGFIIKCKIPSGGYGYIRGQILSGQDWDIDNLAFTANAREAHVFPTLDAALRVKEKVRTSLEEVEIIDLDKPTHH